MAARQNRSQSNRSTTRRSFIRTAGAVAGAVAVNASLPARAHARVLGANDRIGIGFIGCGGRGGYTMNQLKEMRDAGGKFDIVAVCDTYRPRMDKQALLYKIY